MDKTPREMVEEFKKAGFNMRRLADRFECSPQTLWNLRSGITGYAVKGLEEKIKRFHGALKEVGFF